MNNTLVLPAAVSQTWLSDHRFQVELDLLPDQPWFHGHFEQAPVLAGVIQLGWVLGFAEQQFQQPLQFQALQLAKFQRLIQPPLRLRLEVDYNRQRQLLKFKYSDARGSYSTGGVLVAPL